LLIKKYPDVQVTFPPVNSAQNTIHLKGQGEQVEGVRKELLESHEKLLADRQARSFEVRFTVKPEYRSIIFGIRGRTIINLRQKYDVKIDVANSQTPSSAVVPTPSVANNDDNTTTEQPDDQQATPQENLPSETTNSTQLTDTEIIITGYEDKALACRDEILQLIKDFQAKITMEIEIDRRIHARIIGSGGQKLQQIMKDYNVEIKFQGNNQNDKVHVTGLDQDKIDACIDHLLLLEEDYLQDLPYRAGTNSQPTQNESTFGQQSANAQTQPQPPQQQQQEVPSTNNLNIVKSTRKDNKQQRQAPFKVKNAPWTPTEQNGFDNEQKRMNNGHKKSPRKGSNAPNKDDLGEFPTFTNGLTLTPDDNSSQVDETTVNKIPVIWGPPKRNK
jgi:uncharacterized protein YajQ (UPF0234 family)